MTDREKNRFSARAKRYAKVGTRVGGVAARIAASRALGRKQDRDRQRASGSPLRSAVSRVRS